MPRPSASATHRAAMPTGHRRAASPAHRAIRPHYGRLLAVAVALGVTAVAVLGALGVLGPSAPSAATTASPAGRLQLSGFFDPRVRATGVPPRVEDAGPTPQPTPLPADAGTGKRVVFSLGGQRVWLVESGGQVVRTYLVSGSLTDNLRPGVFEVYSTSRHAVGVDDSGTMEYMVRFTRGEHAPIGFHDIPVHEGKPVQAVSDLGTPQSHGCVRQRHRDARALWRFAPVGTTVVVTA